MFGRKAKTELGNDLAPIYTGTILCRKCVLQLYILSRENGKGYGGFQAEETLQRKNKALEEDHSASRGAG
ncbi:hypothetical protein SUGI_0821240 [Cryptomeria japonica]|nr:hypothetical protein SUGI_0821240 [Cryptomeria japonica]